MNLVCDYAIGQCPCLTNVAEYGVENTLGMTDDLQVSRDIKHKPSQSVSQSIGQAIYQSLSERISVVISFL